MIKHGHGLTDMLHSKHFDAFDNRSFMSIFKRNDEPVNSIIAGANCDGKRAADRPDGTIETQFAND